MTRSETIAKDLLSIKAVFFSPDQPFTWASGIHSPIYCDNRLTLSDVKVREDVETGLAELVKENYPDAEILMGTSTAGIAHAAITGYKLGLPMGYVRTGSKDHGRKNQIEGKLEKGQKTVVVEDLISREPLPAPKFWINPEIKDFYAFTTDDIKLIDYVTGEQIKDIPIAI